MASSPATARAQSGPAPQQARLAVHGLRVPVHGPVAPAVEAHIARTLPAVLAEQAQARPDAIALRAKKYGVYQGYSWARYQTIVEEVALGLIELGFRPGDRLAIMGDPTPEWMFADFGAMAAQGITAGIYPTSSPEEVAYLMRDCGASVFVAETQEHLDKLLAVIEQVPHVRAIVVIDTRALFMFKHALLHTFDELRRLGAARRSDNPGEYAALVAGIAPDDPAAILYTSGTTGLPKGAVLSHRCLLAGAETYFHLQPELRTREHRVVMNLPLAHGAGRTMAGTIPLTSKVIPFFCEEIDNFIETFRDVAPDFLALPPRFYEKFAAQLLIGIETSSPLKRQAYKLAFQIGSRMLAKRRAGASPSSFLALGYWLARQVVFRQMLEKIGLQKVGVAYTGSAPMPPQVVQVWHAWGVDLREIYASTECFGIAISQAPRRFPVPGDIGTPIDLAGYETKVAADGELLLRCPMLFMGYWNQPAETDAAIDADGWYRSGDIVKLTPENYIRLVDRKRDIIITSGGKTMSPQQIESAIRGSTFIGEAIVFGDARRYVTALLQLDYTVVSEWARARKLAYTSYSSLVSHPDVVSLIAAEVEQQNVALSRVEQVKKFRIIPYELDPEQGETTPTHKVKRAKMYELFGALVEEMYADGQDGVIEREAERIA